MSVTGSCLCGAVAYEVDGSFAFAGNCHCSICRRLHGAAFATWGILGEGEFRWLRGEEQLTAYETSAGNSRAFCSRCGSPLVSMHSGRVGEIVLASVDGDPGMKPREHIFVGSKADWYDISDSLPQHEEWPPGLGG